MEIITKRRLLVLGKVIRMPCKFIPARLISAFLKDKGPLGRHNTTPCHTF